MADNFVLKRISDVICIDATVAEKYDFLATHLPFKNLKFASSDVLTQATVTISEEEFFKNEVMNKRDRHNFVVVRGDAGSGKSHFIRWVKERYESQVNPKEEVVLLISRSQNTLRGALEQIIDSNVFSEGFKSEELKKLIDAREHLSENELKFNILFQFASASENDENNDGILDRRYKSKVRDYLMDRGIEKLLCKKGGPIERIMSKLTAESVDSELVNFEEPRFHPDDFIMDFPTMQNLMRDASRQARRLAEDLINDERGPEIREKLTEYLNSKLETVIQNTTNLRSTDLKRIFDKLRIELKNQGKNLTLFIEDITSFTGIDRALVEVLVTEHRGTEHNEKFCRLYSMIGITSGYYKTSFPDNLRDRVTGRVEIDNAILTSSRETAEMAARYINAINLRPETLIDWMEKDEVDSGKLPISEKNMEHSWANFTLQDNKVMSIFPFNEAALWNMYKGIPENDKTPREFLKRVILNLVKLYVSNPQEFPPSPTVLSAFFKVPQWRNSLHEQRVENEGGAKGSRLKSLLLLWGDASISITEDNGVKHVGTLTREVFDSFGLPFISGTNDASKVEPTKPELPKPEPGANLPIIPPAPSKETKEEKEFREIQEEINNWHDKNDKLRNYGKLRDDVCDVLTDFIDWKALSIPSSFVQSFFKKTMISIEGQTGLINPGFQVKRNSLSKRALLALSAWRYLGKGSWKFAEAEDHLLNLQNWMLSVKDEVIKSVVSPMSVQDVDISQIPKHALLVEFYVQAFSGNLNPSVQTTSDLYNSIYRKLTLSGTQDGRSKQFRDVQAKIARRENDFISHHDMLMHYYNCIQGDVTRTLPDNYFENATPILELIKQLKKSDWNLEEVIIPDIDSKEDNVCYKSLKLLNFFKGTVYNAIEGERERSKEILEKLSGYIDGDFSSANIIRLFKEIKSFLTETLRDINDMNYNSEEFQFLLSGKASAKNFEKAYKRVIDAMNAATMHDQLTMYSSNPNAALDSYIALLENFDKFLDKTITKYTNRLAGYSVQTKGVEKVIDDTNGLLIDLKNNLESMGKGGNGNA